MAVAHSQERHNGSMKLLRLAATAALLAAVVPGTAVADHRPTTTTPGAQLELSVTHVAGNGMDNVTYSADLQCMPTAGTHTSPYTACATLKEVDGNFDRLPRQDWRSCTEDYKPVILTAVGVWKGRDVYWESRYGNECQAQTETGGLFDF
jgi:hypothetical protein